MLCLAENTLISFVTDPQLFLWPRTHTHTHTQNYCAYVRKVFVININIIGVFYCKGVWTDGAGRCVSGEVKSML